MQKMLQNFIIKWGNIMINLTNNELRQALTDDQLDGVSGGMEEWPADIEKAAGMFLVPDYDEEYIKIQCIMMGLDFEKVKACAQDLGYI